MIPDTARRRLLTLWVPDWPVVAHLAGAASARRGAVHPAGGTMNAPVAVLAKGQVLAVNQAGRDEGVRRGMRRREAQARCPGIRLLDHDPATDARAFEPVLAALEESLPGLHPVRPGLVAVRARGPARYYGGERTAALTALGILEEVSGVPGRAGVADGLFAAERAAMHGGDSVTIVPGGGNAEFLAPLPVAVLGDPELASLLPRLGLHTLGDFAALADVDVVARFGPEGARLHALAAGRDPRATTPRIPPRDVEALVDLEPPLDRVDQLAFAVRGACDALVEELLEQKLVATAVRVELVGDRGEAVERVWLHPRSFTGAEVVDRVRWTVAAEVRPSRAGLRPGAAGAEAAGPEEAAGLRSAVTRVRVTPEAVDPVGAHERGLWGTGPDDGVHSGLSRVQGMLGHTGVGTAEPVGGRSVRERQEFVPWGDRPQRRRDAGRPWPGALPPPAPATVFELPRSLRVEDRAGRPVTVDDRAELSAAPAVLVAPTGARRRLTAWAGPWPLDERWWDATAARRAHRFQAVDEGGEAWLLVLDERGWWAEGRYD